jgi:hypothetical protein
LIAAGLICRSVAGGATVMTGEWRIALFFLGVLAIIWATLAAVGVFPFGLSSLFSNFVLYLSAWFFFAAAQVLHSLYRHRPDRPIRFVRDTLFGPAYRRRLAQSAPLLIAVVLFMPGFSAMKSAIPLFNDYGWDQRFINLDLALHGQDPWRILQPLLGHPLITSAMSVAYHLWILLIYAGTIFFALHVDDRTLRQRYFAAFFGIWTVNGVVLATLFASVGPCFLETMTGNAHFADQMAYLLRANEIYPVMVVDVQQQLIAWHASGSHGLGRGISAMPSMHVALAFLFFLAIRKVGRALGIVFFLFFLLTLIGSVHLAYHYAVDGYVAIVTTAIIWAFCGALFQRRRTAAQLESLNPA